MKSTGPNAKDNIFVKLRQTIVEYLQWTRGMSSPSLEIIIIMHSCPRYGMGAQKPHNIHPYVVRSPILSSNN